MARTRIPLDKLRKFKEELIEVYSNQIAKRLIVGELYILGIDACRSGVQSTERECMYKPMLYMGTTSGNDMGDVGLYKFLLNNKEYYFGSCITDVWKFKGTDINDVVAWDILTNIDFTGEKQ